LSKKKILSSSAIIACICIMLVASIPQTEAQFTLSASWTAPTTYGDGIHSFVVYENESGDWVDIGYSALSGNFEIGNKITNWTNWANQGITQDGTYVYTTNTTIVMKYTKAGVFVSTHDCSVDSGLAETNLGGLCYYDGHIYITAHTDDSTNGSVLEYDTDLVFVAEYDTPEPTVADNLAMGGISYHDGYFWAISDSQTDHANFQITQYDTDMIYVDSYEVTSFDIIDNWHYQGLDWYGDYILANLHESAVPVKIDVYQWGGAGFIQVGRIEQPSYPTDGTNTFMSQDLSIEYDGGLYYIWFASRGDIEGKNEVSKFRLIINSGSSNTFSIDADTDIKLDTYVTLNYTQIGLTEADHAEGINYIRLNVTVTNVGVSVFSQNNFTYDAFIGYFETGTWCYLYELVLSNIFTEAGAVYVVTVTYEIYSVLDGV